MNYLKTIIWSIGAKVYANKTLRKFLRPYYRKIVFKKQDLLKNERFKENGLRVIDEFDRTLSDNSISYILMFGSLLGAIREKGFIKHDLDIDIAISNEDYSPKINTVLTKEGFKLLKSINVDGGFYGREETYEKDGIGIDIFYLYEYSDRQKYVCCFRNFPGSLNFDHSIVKFGGLLPVQYYFPFDGKIERVLFENKLYLPIPRNAHEIARCIYGDSYMIPQPNRIAGSFQEYQNILSQKIGKYSSYI